MKLLVLVEQHDGAASPGSLGVLGAARELATANGAQLEAVLVGSGVGELAQRLPVDVVRVAEGDRFAAPTAGAVADAVVEAARAGQASHVLASASVLAAEVAGIVAGRLGIGINTDADGMRVVDGELVLERPSLDDTVVVHCGWAPAEPHRGVGLFRAGSFAPVEPGAPGTVEQLQVEPSGRPEVEHLGMEQANTGGVDITQADVLVGAGRGLGGPDKFELVESLARTLGGEVATTRAVVDAGWYDYATQVGQTGKTVQPKLYIAVGISGAIQHKIGMQNSGTIVAINKDANAPIFEYADFGVVGDLFQVVPKLEEKLRERKG